eukprot:CCRYP_018739-RA/>CCRYP_018739-RA protein AED:0.42 eAED:0.42 QI:146/1/1/1/1/1/2/623/757
MTPINQTMEHATPPSPLQNRPRRYLRRRRSLLTVAYSSILILPSSSAPLDRPHHTNIMRSVLESSSFVNANNPSPLLSSSSSSCDPNQAELRLTLTTDAHSMDDNSWRFSTTTSTTVIQSGSVVTDDAVVESSACLDAGGEGIQCWDFELQDEFGDGLTAPHSGSGGTPGSFTLHYNDQLIASHNAVSCLIANEDGKFNKCASEFGFEYCGLRICRVHPNDNDEEPIITVSNLKGSQCRLIERTCGGTAPSLFRVTVDTDGYSEDISWDLRDVSGNVVMSGGDSVENADGIATLAQAGSAVQFDDYESFNSTMCLSANEQQQQSEEECYDFRAYDVYGDGMSCGADGSISLSFPGGSTTTLVQRDGNVARLQRLDDGKKGMACIDKKSHEAIPKWSFCHVRICQGGSVLGLEGNQCSFGNRDLIDPNATGEIIGNGMQLNSQALRPCDVTKGEDCTNAQIFSTADNPQAFSYQVPKEDGPCVDEDCTMAQIFSITKPELMSASIEEKGDDLSWAEYFHPLVSGSGSSSIGNTLDSNTFEDIQPQSSQGSSHKEYKLSLDPFYVPLLSPDSPYHLQYYRPRQMSNAISTYLLSYLFTNIEGWQDGNAPLHFELDCNRSFQQFGSDTRRVVQCEGNAVFAKSSLPETSVMNDLVHQAFAGKYHDEFLEFMYTDYSPDGGDNSDLTKKEKKEQKLEAIQHQQQLGSDGAGSDATLDKKEKKEQKMAKLTNGLNERSNHAIRNNRKANGRHLRFTASEDER